MISSKHRLPLECYKGFIVTHFIININPNSKELFNPSNIQIVEKIILTESKKQFCNILVYLFMPDHLHLILQGKKKDSNVKICMDRIKQKSGYYLCRFSANLKLAKSYYDHIIRNEDNINKHILYILNNPVRKGLIQHWKEWDYKGSSVYTFNEFLGKTTTKVVDYLN